MARMIDGDKIVEALSFIAKCWSVSPFVSKEKHLGAVSMLREVEREVKEAPTLTQPNEPLTLDELQEMDGQPVWVEELNRWALVDLMYYRGDELIMVLFDDGDIKVRDVKLCNLHCYRRPEEGGA